MASATTLSVAEYLHTNFRPDREYIDGDVRERIAGKREHARVQALLACSEDPIHVDLHVIFQHVTQLKG